MVKFPWGNNTASNKAVVSSKVARNTTSTKDVSQSRLGNELDRLLIKIGPAEITQDQTKEVFDKGESINFQFLFQHTYYASNNTNFQHNYHVFNHTPIPV